MKKILLFLFLSLIAKVNYAQSDSSKRTMDGMIYYSPPGFFRAAKFTVNGNQESFSEINTRLMNAKVSANEFNQFRKYRDLTYYMGGAAFACLIGSAIAVGNSNSFKNTSSKVLLGFGCGFIIPEYIFARKRNKHYARAFDLYNQQFQ